MKKKIADIYFFLYKIMPFEFLVWIPHEKLADKYLFSLEIMPFSFCPLKKYGCSLVSRISQKLLKLDP